MDLKDAIELARKGEHTKALDIYNQIINNDPNNLDAYGNRAWLFLCMGDYENAMSDYLHILEKNPNDKEAKRRMADILYQLGDHEKAANLMKELLGEDPLDRSSLEICIGWTHAVQDETSREGRSGSGLESLNPVIEAIEKTMSHESSSSRPEVGRFLYSFVRMLKAGIVVETGTFVGYSSLCKGCVSDWNVIAERLQPGGIDLLHDVEPKKVWWLLGPPYMVSSITSGKQGRFSVLGLPTPDGAGLGIIQKKDELQHKRLSPTIPALVREILVRMINRIDKK